MSIFSSFLRSFLSQSSALSSFGGGRATVIPDGNDEPLSSRFDGQRFVLNKGDETLVDGEPVLTIDDDRVSFRNRGTAETTGDTATIDIQGDKARIDNQRHGKILAEDTGIEISGEHANIQNRGLIDGGFNGVNFANGGESSGRVTNYGTIQSDSRAVNIGGDGISINNYGRILGTDDQRNGTIYSDGTAENFRILNGRRAEIDAGEGNDGAGIALQTGDHVGDAVRAWVTNHGVIEGRGQAAANTGQAGDGIRIFSGVEGGGTTFKGDIYNSGKILSESEQGPTSAIRISDGLSFDGKITNTRHGLIDGENNGLYFGDAEHDAQVRNFGTIQSGSRAVNIDGSGVELENYGKILGTDDQRNGTVYADGTAEDYSITNGRFGRIDAGHGNDGAGIALQTGDSDGDTVRAEVTNYGTIQGRGQGDAASGLAGDGLRIFSGVPGGESETFEGDIYNSGRILSESNVGPTAAVRFANGVGFSGTLTNARNGLIDGANNGLYFGVAEHDAEVNNHGTIQSDSRAVNIDGSGVELNNFGKILGTDNQRNGTVYADGTAEDYSVNNQRGGLIDAGRGNDGAGVSLQTGDEDGDVVDASVTNYGDIVGRGDGVGNLTGDGIRLFTGVDGEVTFEGDIENRGEILSEEAAGIRIAEGVELDGAIQNYGTIEGDVAIDASLASGSVTVENHGTLIGDVLLSEGSDLFDSSYGGSVDGTVFGNGGDDEILAGASDDVLVGGLGDDTLDGGRGVDTTRFDDADVGVQVDLTAGTATRETGFDLSIAGLALVNPNAGIDASAIVDQGAAGNLYFNIHSTDFPSGEIRGNLTEVVSDETVGGVRTLVLRAELNGASEVPAPTDTDATGSGLVTFVVAADSSVTYDLDLSVSGLNTADLLPVNIGNGTLSPIHLHNAAPGVNGPVVVDLASDGGFDVANGDDAFALAAGFDLVSETDSLEDIENVVGSNDADKLVGDAGANRLEGLDGNDEIFGGSGGGADTLIGGDGDDLIAGGGGTDVIDGGDGNDTNSFFNINATAPDPTVAGVDVQLSADGSGTAVYTVAQGPAAGTVINESFTGIENIVGTNNDDRIIASGGAANTLEGGAGDDFIAGGGGTDVIDGGAGDNDTNSFFNINVGAPDPTVAGVTAVINDDGTGTAVYTVAQGPAAGTVINESFTGIENLDGSENDDSLTGNNQDNLLTGNGGADSFVFLADTGEDTVTDFENDSDQLDVSAFFGDAADAVAAARQDGADTVIDLDVGNGDSVRLTGVNLAQIDETDFIV